MTADEVVRTLHLAAGEVATLIHVPALRNTRGAVLYVHGFADYFFQTHLAEHFTARGYDFYAVDLRRYGRSLRPGDIPYFTTELATYQEELDRAVEQIRADGHRHLIVLAHSTGGLIVPLWLHDRRDAIHADALVLNSPWLDLQENWLMRTVGTWLVRAIGPLLPRLAIPQGLNSVYAESISAKAHGEWEFNTAWKPLTPQPVYLGWLAAVRRGQARLHKGLDLPMPVLVMHSDTSRLDLKEWSPAAMSADTVLDVGQIEHWAPALGPDVTTVAIDGGLHDLFLSPEPVRQTAFSVMDTWLDHAIDRR
ncbi:MAG: alpha/beta hydrolase [Thermomicrobiales bacterium]